MDGHLRHDLGRLAARPWFPQHRGCRTALKSVLTQLWCIRGTCGTFAGIDDKSVISRKRLLRSEQRELRRVFKTGQGWILEAHGQNSAVLVANPSRARAIVGIGVL
jgi:hypothetical protein